MSLACGNAHNDSPPELRISTYGGAETNDTVEKVDDEDKIPTKEIGPQKDNSESTVKKERQDHGENENLLKERLAQCKSLIETLRSQLNEEKAKLRKEKGVTDAEPAYSAVAKHVTVYDSSPYGQACHDPGSYSARVENKLVYDENLVEYEKQLEKYQNTLTMAQMEKKNAIRKQMLAKAFKLKLLEVENQCNIELLRIKQSLQCLEPLKAIADSWNTSDNKSTAQYDYCNYELMLPRYPELSFANELTACSPNLDDKLLAVDGAKSDVPD